MIRGFIVTGVVGALYCSSIQAAIYTADIKAGTVTVSAGSSINSIPTINSLSLSYSYDTSTVDCSIQPVADCTGVGQYRDVLLDLQVHVNTNTGSLHWNLGKFGTAASPGVPLLKTGAVEFSDGVSDVIRIGSTEPTVAGSQINGQSAESIELRFNDNSGAMIADTNLVYRTPETSSATLCIRFQSDSQACGNGAGDLLLSFDPVTITGDQRLQWANPSPQGNKFTDVVWNADHQLYLAVGQNGTVMSSSNAKTWVMRNSGIRGNSNAVVWANNNYVAVGQEFIASSSDGIEWNVYDRPRDDFKDIVWDNTFYIALSSSSPTQSRLVISANGKQWENQPEIAKQFVALNTEGSRNIALGNSARTIEYSDDLLNWSVATLPSLPRAIRFYDITLHNGIYYAVGAGSTIISSVDGVNWTKEFPDTYTLDTLYRVKWVNNHLMAVGTNGVAYTCAD